MRWKLSCLLICFLFITQLPKPTIAQNYILEITKFDTYFRVPEVAIPTVSHNVYNTSIGNKEALEWEIVLNQKVLFQEISFQFQSKNLKFCYQAPLTEELNVSEYDFVNATHAFSKFESIYRPLNVVGSYAVLHTSKRGNEYTTGKLFHIYRPFLIDAKLQTSWANISITNNILTITVDQNFLSTATYPIIIDPTFGKTDAGATETFLSPDYVKTTLFTNTEGSGTATNIAIWGYQVGANVRACIYDDDGSNDPDNLLDNSDEVTWTDGAKWHNHSVTCSISDNTKYHLGWNDDATVHSYYDSDSATWNWKSSSYPAFPNPFGTPGGGGDRLYSIYCNFTLSEEGQELEFDLFENLLLYASGSATKALGFLHYENLNLFGSSQMLKEFGFLLGETVRFYSSSQTAKELAFITGAVIKFWGSTIESFEGVALDLTFILYETVNLVASIVTDLEVTSVVTELDAGSLAGLALIVAVIALSLVFVYRKNG